MQSPRPLGVLVTLLLALPAAAAEYRFDGHLDDGGRPANGLYDLQLTAFPAEKAGATLAAPIVFERVPVADGRFLLTFDLPADADAAWVEVAVREPGAGAFSRIPTRTKAIAAPLIGQCWATTGDSGSSAATNFLGTTDDQPLVLRTRNVQSLRIEPSFLHSDGLPFTANVIAGSRLNAVETNVRGATISGGGKTTGADAGISASAGGPNRVTDTYGTVGGGYKNVAGDDNGPTFFASAQHATVSGGRDNSAAGTDSTVGGGSVNLASGQGSSVAGGRSNRALGANSTVAGGSSNLAALAGTNVGGGESNTAQANFASVGGGLDNMASGNSAVVAGGSGNTASLSGAGVHSGVGNCAGGAFSASAGNNAKVRPGSGSGAAGAGCTGVASSGDVDGDEGTYAWADSNATAFTSTGPNQFLVRATGALVLQKQIAAETSARAPRGYFNVVQGDSGLAQPATPRIDTVAFFESDTDAFVRILAPSIEEKGLIFATPESIADGGIVYLGTDVMQFRTNGNVPRMTLGADGTLALQTLGAAGATQVCRNASNQFASCSSSARYKEQIADLDLGLAAVLRLRPVGYVWKDGGMADVGFVAEEVAKLDERLVTRNDQGEVEGVKYDRLSALLAGAVQELAARESLQAEAIARLQAERAAADRRQARVERELTELRALVDGLRRERR